MSLTRIKAQMWTRPDALKKDLLHLVQTDADMLLERHLPSTQQRLRLSEPSSPRGLARRMPLKEVKDSVERQVGNV